MSNYYGYVSVDALMDFAHNHVNGMIDSNDIARFPKANVKDANEQQSLQQIFGVSLDRLRELAEAEREGRVVVLPCKVGDLIYDIRGDWETGKRLLVPHRVRSVYTEQKDGGTVEWEMYVSDFAFRVTKNTRMYFTKSEAERALAATEPKGDADV